MGWWFAVLRSSAAAIKMRRRLFLSPSACSTEGFFAEKCLSYPAQLSVKGVCKGEARFPFALFCFLLQEQKERPGGEPYRLCTLQNLRDAFRRPPILP